MALRYSAALALGLFLLLSCSHTTLVLAHEAEADGHHANMDQAIDDKPTYFSLGDHVGLLYMHIALMTVAWVIILPVAVMLSIVASRYTISTQVAFLVTNILGLVTALSYNARTLDLYPNNAHHKIGWIITNVVTVQVLLGAIARGRSAHAASRIQEQAEQSFMPIRTTVDDNEYVDEPQNFRHSNERSCGNSIELLESQRRVSETTQVESGAEYAELLTTRKTADGHHSRHCGLLSAVIRFVRISPQTIFSKGLWDYVAFVYKATDRFILPFGFIALATGIATMGRFFEGDGFFNGLAHWIKGGVFFWLGLFNLGRWAGSFADFGWAWNVRPRRANGNIPPSAEFIESFLIFFYGSTNIFLEHLSNTDGKWTAQDLEHIAITVLFIGGGLCGMLVESTTVRNLLNAAIHTGVSCDGNGALNAPASYDFSLNPIPALVICLLGLIMGSHHQTSMTSTMVHKQWGNLLFGASFSRCLTYILVYLRPPSSILPSRPPTELLTAFGLIAGGIVFMASSRDTVDGMVQNDLDAMFFYTVTMGLVGILMAWGVVVLALKGLALRKENRHTFSH